MSKPILTDNDLAYIEGMIFDAEQMQTVATDEDDLHEYVVTEQFLKWALDAYRGGDAP